MQRAEARMLWFVTVTKVNQTNQVMAYIVYVCSVFSFPLHLCFLSPTKHRLSFSTNLRMGGGGRIILHIWRLTLEKSEDNRR